MPLNNLRLLVVFTFSVLCLDGRPTAAQTEPRDVTGNEATAIEKEVIAAWTKRQQAVDAFSITYMTTVIKTPEGLKHLQRILALLEVGNANEQLAKDISMGQIYFVTHQIIMQDDHLRKEYWKYTSAEEQQDAVSKLTPGEGSDDLFVTNGEEATSLDPKSRVPNSEKTFRQLGLQDRQGYDLSSIDTEMLFRIVRGMLPEVQERFPLATVKLRLIPKSQKHAEYILAIHDNLASNHIHELTLDRSRGCIPVEYKSLNRQNGQASVIVNIEYPEDEVMPLFPSGWTTSWILPDGALKRVNMVSVSKVEINNLSAGHEIFEIPILEGTMVSNDRIRDRTKGRSRFSIMYDGKLRPIDVFNESYWEALERVKGESVDDDPDARD